MVVNLYRLVAKSDKRIVRAQRQACSKIKAARRAFDEVKRDKFRKYYTGYKKPPFDIHHILPVALGGGNDWQNLCLVPHDLHAVIHEYIDEQIDGMNYGETRQVIIPILSTCKIWNPYGNPSRT